MASNLNDPIGAIDTTKIERLLDEVESNIKDLRNRLSDGEVYSLDMVLFRAREARRAMGRVERYVAGLVV